MARLPSKKDQEIYSDLRAQFKKIEDYTDEDLNAVINVLGFEHPEYFTILNFIDCYFERRRRKQLGEALK